MQAFLSVIIPTYNRHDSLLRTLYCVFVQTYPSTCYEIIVVDDGSQDKTPATLRQLSSQGRLTFVRQAHAGPAAARNAGACVARGKMLVFTDDDCLPEPDWLVALATSYTEHTAIPLAGIGGVIRNCDEGHWLHQFAVIQGHHQSHTLDMPDYLDTANACYQQTVFEAVGGFREMFVAGEDTDLGLRCKAAGYQFISSNHAVVWHVGRTSLRGLLTQAWLRGQGDALLYLLHPTVFTSPSRSKFRQSIRHLCKHLMRVVDYTPTLLRPWVQAVGAVAYAMLRALVDLGEFTRHTLPVQGERYRLAVSTVWLVRLYLVLEWWYYLVRLSGRVVGTFHFTYRQVQEEQK